MGLCGPQFGETRRALESCQVTFLRGQSGQALILQLVDKTLIITTLRQNQLFLYI